MSLGLHKINRNRALSRGEVGNPGEIPPMSKELSPPNPTIQNKRGIDLVSSTAYRKALYFANGDSFSKVRGMINLMRSKLNPKFARKNKKG